MTVQWLRLHKRRDPRQCFLMDISPHRESKSSSLPAISLTLLQLWLKRTQPWLVPCAFPRRLSLFKEVFTTHNPDGYARALIADTKFVADATRLVLVPQPPTITGTN